MPTPSSFPTRTKTKHEHELELAFLRRECRLVVPVIGHIEFPSAWDKLHARINTVLDLWATAPAQPTYPTSQR